MSTSAVFGPQPPSRRPGCKLCRGWLLRTGKRKPKEVPLASTVEIAPGTEADLPLLFGLAKGAFVDLPG